MAGGEEVRSSKAALRERMRALRDAVPPEVAASWARDAEDLLFSRPEMAPAASVLVFYSFGSEISTTGIIERLQREGRTVVLPFLEGGTMRGASYRPGETLRGSGYGPKEPATLQEVDPADIDVAVSPGLAFDRRGHRLGYGGGHFDSYLPRLRPEAVRIAIGYHLQLVEEVPHDDLDATLDMVVTEEEVVVCRPRRLAPP